MSADEPKVRPWRVRRQEFVENAKRLNHERQLQAEELRAQLRARALAYTRREHSDIPQTVLDLLLRSGW